MKTLEEILEAAPVMPFVSLNDVQDAVPVAKALAAGGISALEIGMRTEVGAKGIAAIRMGQACDEIIVGAGTVITTERLSQAIEAKAQFAVSPVYNEKVMLDLSVKYKDSGIYFIPGAQTMTEISNVLDHRFNIIKLFPVDSIGGDPRKFINSVAAIYSDVKLCPSWNATEPENMIYLRHSNVLTIAAAWVAPADLINAKKFDLITERAKAVVKAIKDVREAASDEAAMEVINKLKGILSFLTIIPTPQTKHFKEPNQVQPISEQALQQKMELRPTFQ